jgi:hypothetical protein
MSSPAASAESGAGEFYRAEGLPDSGRARRMLPDHIRTSRLVLKLNLV